MNFGKLKRTSYTAIQRDFIPYHTLHVECWSLELFTFYVKIDLLQDKRKTDPNKFTGILFQFISWDM